MDLCYGTKWYVELAMNNLQMDLPCNVLAHQRSLSRKFLLLLKRQKDIIVNLSVMTIKFVGKWMKINKKLPSNWWLIFQMEPTWDLEFQEVLHELLWMLLIRLLL
jgi:hypothetical protein